MQITTVIISRVGRELSPGGTPPAAVTIVVPTLAYITYTDPITAKTETAVIPASIPARERVGRRTVGALTGDELSKEDHDMDYAITSVTPVSLTS